MNLKRLGALFVVALLAVPVFAASDATVGEFVVKLAKARNLAATDARVASDALRGVGIRVPADLNHRKQLTEGDVTRLSRLFGLNVTTTTPDDLFDADQVDRFFSTFGTDIGFKNGGGAESMSAAAANNSPNFDPYARGKTNGNGKKKGHNKSPDEPE